MRPPFPHACGLLRAALFLLPLLMAPIVRAGLPPQDTAVPRPAALRTGDPILLWSAPDGMAKAPGDTAAIFGGPGSLEGRFETPAGLVDTQGWVGVDETDSRAFSPWHVSDFHAENLDLTVVPNHALWCGVESNPGWVTQPGYGNGWFEPVDFSIPVADPSIPTTVRLEMVFNHSVESGYDFFSVQVDSAGYLETVDAYTGYNAPAWGNPPPPVDAVFYDRSFILPPEALVGDNGDEVHLRFVVSSDGAWSDEDGLWPSFFGAVQVDNIRVSVNGAEVSYADFEGSAGDADWVPDDTPYVGDFFKVMYRVVDLDPCRTNNTPVATFIDDGTPPSNGDGQSTGGSYSSFHSPLYGGSAVVNYTGGLSLDTVALDNAVVSPPIPWDNPNRTDDDDLDSGAFLRFDVYEDLNFANGLLWNWSVRSMEEGGGWSTWRSRNVAYYGEAKWETVQREIRDLLVENPSQMQIQFRLMDLASLFGLPGNDASPGPYFDNVSVYRYQHTGPVIALDRRQLFHDSFPRAGTLDVAGDLMDLSVRIDTPSQLSNNASPGDSLTAKILPTVPGTSLAGAPRLVWALEAHPLYAAVRQIPAGATLAGTAASGRDIWTGTVDGFPSLNPFGDPIANEWAFDLPDGNPRPRVPGDTLEPALFFAGDVLRYGIVVDDTGGGSSSLPRDLSGLVSGQVFDPRFEIRAMPSLSDDGSTQPPILVWNASAFAANFPLPTGAGGTADLQAWDSGSHHELVRALEESGRIKGVDFDFFVTSPFNGNFDGLGATTPFGASFAQAAGYRTILTNGEDDYQFISAGRNPYSWGAPPEVIPDDAQFLRDWRALGGPRDFVLFADRLGQAVDTSTIGGQTFLEEIAGTSWTGDTVSEFTSGEVDLRVEFIDGSIGPTLVDFTVLSGCPEMRDFHAMNASAATLPPGATSTPTHRFLRRDGGIVTEGYAGLLYQEPMAGDMKSTWSFPFDLAAVVDPRHETAAKVDGRSARAALVEDILTYLGHTGGGGATGASVPRAFTVQPPAPNPFNPRTEFQFVAPSAGTVAARVYDLRGRRVRTLLDGPVTEGTHRLSWNGVDEAGASVASGVYLLVVEGFGSTVHHKIALVK